MIISGFCVFLDLGYFKRSVTNPVAGFRGVRRVGIALGGEKWPSCVGLHLHEVGAVAKQGNFLMEANDGTLFWSFRLCP